MASGIFLFCCCAAIRAAVSVSRRGNRHLVGPSVFLGRKRKGKRLEAWKKEKEVVRSLKKCRAGENARGLRFNRTHWEFQAGDMCISAATEKRPW